MTQTRTQQLRGAVIGAGYFSRFQYEAWSRIPEVEIVAACDRIEDKARAAQAQFGIPRCYTRWTEMLDRERPNFVDIITPPDSHQEMCAFASLRGIHVICQKPLAPTIEEGAQIVETARAARVRFMVHESWRWQPWYRKIREVQTAGTIGDFTHIHMLTRLETDGESGLTSIVSHSSGITRGCLSTKPVFTSSIHSGISWAK